MHPLLRTILPVLALASLCDSQVLHAQGDWTPSTANFTRPYTLTTAGDMMSVRTRIADPQLFPIYTALFDETYDAAIPTDTATTAGRRARARMAKNLAFITHMGKPEGGTLGDFTKNEGAAIRERIREVMRGINPQTGTALDYEEWQWRSKELIDYLIAYDLAEPLLGDGDLDEARERLQTFAGNLHREATRDALGFSFFANIKNNHALMTAAALGMAGVVLHDAVSEDHDMQPTTWIGAALFHIDNVMFRDPLRHMSERGVIAGYAEGPHYLRYAMLNILPFHRALRNVLPDGEILFNHDSFNFVIRHPYHDPNYHNLYEWIRLIRTPDGLMPSIEDTYVHEGFPELALLGLPSYDWPITSRYTTTAQQLNSTVDMRANYLAAISINPLNPTSFRDELVSLPEAGNLVFNSSYETPPFAFSLLAEHGTALESGAGHDQADASSFMIMMGDEMLALDPGYVSYARRGEVGEAMHHNMILVDDQGPEIGTPGDAGDAPATIETAFNIQEWIDSHRGFGYGRIATSYLGAEIERHAFFLHNRYALVADVVSSDEPHVYTWQLHGNGLHGGDDSTGIMGWSTVEREGHWQRNGKHLTAHVVSADGSSDYLIVPRAHEEGYDETGTHSAIYLRSGRLSRAGFLAAMLPDETNNPIDFESTIGEGGTTLISRVAGTHEIFSLGDDTTRRTIPASDLDLPGELQTDAPLVGFAIDPFPDEEPTLMFMHRGTTLNYDGRQYLYTTMRTDVGIASNGVMTGIYSGYVGAAGTITFVATSPGSLEVTGESVESWDYLWATGMLRITFNGPGYFQTQWEGDVAIDPASPSSLVSVHATDDELRVRLLDERTDGVTFRLSDLLGRTIATGSLDDEPIRRLSTTTLSSGLYILSIERNGVVEESRRISITR